jgi:2-oxoglutarate ferredoxin oxidoreductase subunit delta
MASKKKGQTRIHIYPDWCKGCGLCVAFCPADVLEMDHAGKATVAHEEECVNCGYCELHCPDFAILLTPKDKSRAKASAPTETE